jgi:hypothetical protein
MAASERVVLDGTCCAGSKELRWGIHVKVFAGEMGKYDTEIAVIG